jgi:hypothetical protein
MPPKAFLAIRSDIAPDVEAEYLDWLIKEHTIERVGIEGFVAARIYRCHRDDIRRYLILYELENVAVIDSPAYLERLNNPTPWSARMMPHLGNFVRGGGKVTRNLGSGFGAAMIPVLIRSGSLPFCWERLEELSKEQQIVTIRLLQAEADRTSVRTNERSMRSGDNTFTELLFIEAIDSAAMVRVVKERYPVLIGAAGPAEGDDSSYSLIFCLTQSSIADVSS